MKKRAFADVLRTEWDGQVERIDPMTMPMMRLVNTALDGVSVEPQAVKEDIVRFAGTDMLCYRADAPQGLVDRQRLQWDPVLDWAETRLGARFVLAEGVMHVAQPAESIAAFGIHVGGVNDPLELSSLHVVTSLTGSAILAMAVLMGQLNCDEAWTKAHLDEDWNIEQWGRDEEAEARRAHRYKDMQAACLVLEAAA
ncbi:MAG: ATP12 family protein [Pseudomonadota bacterium]